MRRRLYCGLSSITACLLVCSCTSIHGAGKENTPLIAMNQTGFEAGGYQAFSIKSEDNTPLYWTIETQAGEVIRDGESQVFGLSEAAGEHVHTVIVTRPITISGTYLVRLSDTLEPFKVTKNPYAKLAERSLNYFYLNRAGTDISEAFAPSTEWSRKAGHAKEHVTCFHGIDKTGLAWPGCPYILDVTGGWYDAGDHGKYAVNGGISVWMLQNVAERLGSKDGMAEQVWGDGRASLPEVGNGISDILDEARWQIEFLLSLQIPDGTTLLAPVGQQTITNGRSLKLSLINASGMVHHKVHSKNWPAFPLRPEDDTAERFLMPPSTAGTLNMVAVTAQAARIWKGVDDAFSERCLQAAIKGYEAARRNPDIYAYNNFDGGGAYGDFDVSDEFAWAAIELYAATGEKKFISQLPYTPGAQWLERVDSDNLRDIFWADVDLLPLLTILTASDVFSDAEKTNAESAIIQLANKYAVDASKDGYGVPYPPDAYGWGSNGAIASRSLVLGYAYDATGNEVFRNTIIGALDYMLGRNPLNQSYIAGFGTNPVKFVHHRFWGAGADSSFPIAAPGALSGGPNANYPVSTSEVAVLGKCAPQKCWLDDHNGFSINEVAINWNAALFWLVSYLETTSPLTAHSTEPSL